MTDHPGPETGPTSTAAPSAGPPGSAGAPTIRRFRRSRNDRVLAGVGGGLAESLAMDPVIVRVLLVVLTFFGGAGIIVYVACWLLMPEDDRESSLAERAIARGGRTSWPLLVLAGAIGLAAVLSAGWVVDDRGLLLIALFAIAAILLSRRERDLAGPAVTDPRAAPFPSAAPFPPAPAPAPWTAGAPWAASAFPPAEPLPPLPPAPPAPRSLLGRITFALVLLGLGVLAAADLAGADVPAAAYPALVVAGAGLGLLVGARYGRGRWLIALGVLGVLALPPTVFADSYRGDWVDQNGRAIVPTTAADIAPEYSYRGGRVILDLSQIDFTDRTVATRLQVGVGHLTVVLPPEVDVRADLDLGVGVIEAFGFEHNGFGLSEQRRDEGTDGPGGGTLELEVEQGIGQVEVTRATA